MGANRIGLIPDVFAEPASCRNKKQLAVFRVRRHHFCHGLKRPWVKKEMGRAAVACMKNRFTGENIVAVTGGTTLEAVAEMMTPDSKNRKLLFVPARGGLGENVRNQANTICAHMAEKASGTYKHPSGVNIMPVVLISSRFCSFKN